MKDCRYALACRLTCPLSVLARLDGFVHNQPVTLMKRTVELSKPLIWILIVFLSFGPAWAEGPKDESTDDPGDTWGKGPTDESTGESTEEVNPVNPELLERFTILVRRARAVERHGPGAVIKVYTEAIVDPVYEAYGQIHLKLGQLFKSSGRLIDSAYHFQKCLQDHRVDELDRTIICRAGYEDTTTTLTLVDQPSRASIVVVEPKLFSGPFKSGERLPIGFVRLVVELPGHFPHEQVVELKSPTRWVVELGMKRRRGPLVPDDFLGDEKDIEADSSDQSIVYSEPPADVRSRRTLPYWVVGSLGLVAGTTGIVIGQMAVQESRNVNADKPKLRDRAIMGDIIAWSGYSVAGGTLLWYLLSPQD